jgi:hypothetical protein
MLPDHQWHVSCAGLKICSKFKTSKDLGQAFAQMIDALLADYEGGYTIFDNNDKQ